MSVVWTTIVIVALLLPGVFFFVGVATRERLSREIIRSGVVSEIALATMVAVILHTICVVVISAFGFRLSAFLIAFTDYSSHHHEMIHRISHLFLPTVIYFLATAGLGFGCGCLVAVGIVQGPLRFLAKHKWVYDIVDRDRKGGTVTAFVMTDTVESGKVLMYRGRVHEVFLVADGKISYVVLKNCARFYMTFDDGVPTTGKQLELFNKADAAKRRLWDYLLIEGENIKNILFDPSPETIRTSDEGLKALHDALRQQQEANRLRFELMQLRRAAANTPSTDGKLDASKPQK
jgi:hypothetical protein